MNIGVDIGASKTLIAAQDLGGELIDPLKFDTPSDFGSFAQQLKQSLEDYARNQQVETLIIGAPGVIDEGIFRGGGRLPWKQVDILEPISSIFTNSQLGLINDAAAAGLYEANYGNGKNHNVVLYITISTGIGTAIITNGQLTDEFTNSEGGQIILDHHQNATFESLASGKAFVEHYGHQGKDETDDKVWSDYGRLLGSGIFSMAALLQPEVIIIGGSMGSHFNKYEATLNEHLIELAQMKDHMFKLPQVTPAKEPETAVIRGCLIHAQRMADA